jgi:hypothetical protein
VLGLRGLVLVSLRKIHAGQFRCLSLRRRSKKVIRGVRYAYGDLCADHSPLAFGRGGSGDRRRGGGRCRPNGRLPAAARDISETRDSCCNGFWPWCCHWHAASPNTGSRFAGDDFK